MKKYIGNKNFYMMVLAIAVPIMIQNGITNFVGLLDNVMVGQIGTEQMSGVAIANQLMFVFNICIFGAVSGAGIFSAQFFGCGDHKGARDAFRIKLLICGFVTLIGILLFLFSGEALIDLYLAKDGDPEEIKATLFYAKEYLDIMLWGMIPFALAQAYTSSLRENGETVLPMKAGVVAVLVNLVFNYLLIFGQFGCPRMGAAGAAIATVLSRFVELAITVVWTHVHHTKQQFIVGVYKQFHIPGKLFLDVLKKGTPLTLNEALWSIGQTILFQCYAYRGLHVIGALNISSTISNLFNVVFISMGSAIAIILGQKLGCGKLEEAKSDSGKLIAFSLFCSIVLGVIMSVFSPLFPQIYNTTDDVRSLAASCIIVAAICMPLNAITNASYFTLRSGGKTGITFLFDCGFVWILSIPAAFLMSRYTSIPIIPLYFCCQFLDILKCIIGLIMVHKGIWLQNIVQKKAA